MVVVLGGGADRGGPWWIAAVTVSLPTVASTSRNILAAVGRKESQKVLRLAPPMLTRLPSGSAQLCGEQL